MVLVTKVWENANTAGKGLVKYSKSEAPTNPVEVTDAEVIKKKTLSCLNKITQETSMFTFDWIYMWMSSNVVANCN